MIACPSSDRLQAYLADTLEVSERSSLDSHLALCPACQTNLETLTADPATTRWQKLAGRPVSVDNRFVERVLDAARADTKTLDGHASRRIAEPPPILPGYELIGEIGRGGMGIVYRARQRGLNRIVAVKLIQTGSLAEPVLRERFRAEAEAAARLQHPQLVPVYETGEAAGRAYLSMEYLAGGTLADRLRDGPWPVRDAARLVERLARAVDYAHRQGVIHRDLKPSNILFPRSDDSDPDHAKIADFGLAKRLDSPHSLAVTGGPTGTPHYMAPEQATRPGTRPSPEMDVYALCAVLYELLTGTPPFTGTGVFDVLLQVAHQRPVPPSKVSSTVPRDLEAVCLKGLEKNPAARYRSAAALADDLQRFLDGRSTVARPDGPVTRLKKWTRRNPWPTALVAALLAGVAVSGFFAVRSADQAGRAVTALAKAKEAKGDADRRAAILLVEPAHRDAAGGAVDQALFTLIDALRLAPPDAVDVRRAILRDFAGWADRLPTLERYEATGETSQVAFIAERTGQYVLNQGDRLLRSTETGLEPVRSLRTDFRCIGGDISPDGRLLALVWLDRSLSVINLDTGEPVGPGVRDVRSPDLPNPTSFFVHFGDDSQSVAVALVDTNDVRQRVAAWDIMTGKPIGRELWCGWCDTVHLRRTATGRPVAVVFPDGTRVPARAVDFETGATVTPIPDQVNSGARVPDGRSQSVACWFGTIGTWDRTTGEMIRPRWRFPPGWQFPGSGYGLPPVGGDGRHVAILGTDYRIRWFETSGERQVGSTIRLPFGRSQIAVGADHSVIWTSSASNVWQRWLPGRVAPPPGSVATLTETARFGSAAIGPDGTVAFAGDDADEHARLIDPATGQPIGQPLTGASHLPTFSPDGRWVAAARHNSVGTPWVQIWDARTGRPVNGPLVWKQFVHGLSFSPDGKTLAVGYVGSVGLWNVESGDLVRSLPVRGPTVDFVWSPDSERLATVSRSGWTGGEPGLRLWHAPTGKPIGERIAMENAAVVGRSPAGESAIALVPADGHLVRMNLRTGSAERSHRIYPGRRALFAAIRPDANAVAVVLDSGQVRQYDVETGDAIGSAIPLGEGTITEFRYDPTGEFLVLTHWDGTVQLWDARAGMRVGPPFTHRLSILRTGFADDGRTLVTIPSDGSGERWPVPALLPDDPDRLETWLTTAIGVRRSGTDFTFLSPAEWQRLRAEPGNDLPVRAPWNRTTWHGQQARDALRAGFRPAALWHVDRMEQTSLDKAAVFALRSRIRLANGDREAVERDDATGLLHAAIEALRARRGDDVNRIAGRFPTGQPFRFWMNSQSAWQSSDYELMVRDTVEAAKIGLAPVDLMIACERLASLGRWTDIDRILSASSQSLPPAAHHWRLLARRQSGSAEFYAAGCQELFRHVTPTADRSIRADLAWAFARHERSTSDWSVPLNLIETVIRESEADPGAIRLFRSNWQVTRGLLLVRAGRARDAVEYLKEIVPTIRGVDPAIGHACLALAYANAGRMDEARQTVAKLAFSDGSAWDRAESQWIKKELNRAGLMSPPQ